MQNPLQAHTFVIKKLGPPVLYGWRKNTDWKDIMQDCRAWQRGHGIIASMPKVHIEPIYLFLEPWVIFDWITILLKFDEYDHPIGIL